MEDIKPNVTAVILQKKPSARASNNGRIDGARERERERVCMHVCVQAQGYYFEGDSVSVGICPTITVQYHHSGNVLTAYHIYIHVKALGDCACFI
jgi:hypothetical protein